MNQNFLRGLACTPLLCACTSAANPSGADASLTDASAVDATTDGSAFDAGLDGPPPPTPTLPESDEAQKVEAWVKSAPLPSVDSNHFSVIGAVHFLTIGNGGVESVRSTGPKAFYDNAALVTDAVKAIDAQMTHTLPNLAAGGLHFTRDVQTVPWGMVEPEAGVYRYELLDELVIKTQEAGIEFVANIMPFADWDQATNPPAEAACTFMLQTDTFYLAKGGRMGQLHDMEAFAKFVNKVAERYDGDGVDDAPGLKRPVRFWKIYNEPESGTCGGYAKNISGFVTLMTRARQAVLAACPSCKVINGGAAIPQWRTSPVVNFWSDFAKAGGADLVDVIAIHYNQGKNEPNEDQDEYLEKQITTIHAQLGATKPVWMTEFGVLVKNPDQPPPPADASVVLSQKTEAEAASWYFRRYAVGLAAGANRFFSDAQSFFSQKIMWPFWINRLVEVKIGSFTAAKKLAAGQYEFTVGGKAVYALWSSVPADLKGKVRVTDLYGKTTEVDASTVSPTVASPIFVEAAN